MSRCVLRLRVRRSVALAVLLAGSTARADDPRATFGLPPKQAPPPQDPHDLFGLGNAKKPAAKADCTEPGTFGCPWRTDPFAQQPFALSTWLPAAYLRRLPVADSSHDAVAHYALGAIRDDAGISFAGATGLENRWSLEGAPIQAIRTGGADSRIPLTFLDGILVTAGGFAARDRTSTGGTIEARLVRGGDTHEVDATVWGGLSDEGRRRPFAPQLFFVRRIVVDPRPSVSASVVARGPIAHAFGGKLWYAAGIAPSLSSTKFTWNTARLLDDDKDGTPDGLPGPPRTQNILLTNEITPEYVVPAMVRTGLDRGPHALELTLYGQRSHGTRFLANATLQAAGLDRDDTVLDGIATYRATYRRTKLVAQAAWHRSVHREHAHDDAAANLPQLLTAYVPSKVPEEPQLAELCHGPTAAITIDACEVPLGYFASGGAGPLLDLVGDRPTISADVTHVASERHTLFAGATLEDARLATRARYTGGYQLRSLGETFFNAEQRYFHGECGDTPDLPCNYASSSELTYRTRYAAAYVEDTWTPEKDLRVDGGLRWELMWVGPRLHFSNQLAPRGGIAWDPLGGGTSRAWASYGRSYAALPAGLGPTVIRRDPTVTDTTITLGPNPENTAQGRSVDHGASYSVSEGISPMAQDELTLGIELGLARIFRVTAWAQARWLRYGIESTGHGFDNPGREEGLPARRSSELVALEVATNPTAAFTLRAGYMAGKTLGNYLGPYDPRQGAILYDGTQFNGTGDAILTSGNEMGRLPTDIGHRVFVEADRRGSVGPVQLSVAARLTLASGRPRSVFADTDIGVLALLPRGGAGRGAMLSQANVRVAARWQGFDVTLDVFNAFDRGQATAVDEVYTDAETRAIEGGTYEDLVWAKSTTGREIGRRPAFGFPTAFQIPVSAVLGVHRAF